MEGESVSNTTESEANKHRMTPHLLRAVPSAAIMFGVYELCLKFLNTSA